MKDIKQFPRNKITVEELQKFYHIEEYPQLVERINLLIDNGLIEPIKSSKLNGKKPGLYRAYRVLQDKSVFEPWRKEIQFLAPEVNSSFYLGHLDQYENDRNYIQKLNQYFIKSKEKLDNEVSINERSFEIFGREKFLLKEGGIRILHNLGLEIADLNCYKTSQPLAYYSHRKNTGQIMLIIENKDTFFSMRKYLLEGNERIFDTLIGTLIYGGGKGIYRSLSDFDVCVEPYMRSVENHILYFGDLDYEGILIYEQVEKEMKEKYFFAPFTKAYEKMVVKGEKLELPYSKEMQNKNGGNTFFDYFEPDLIKRMKCILEEGRYLPQEILQMSEF
ncbi:MAG: Wadjet anti-phage system protein JetD domain-containing protein [Velocimicrobium sp.]